jgi:hypothetical protein
MHPYYAGEVIQGETERKIKDLEAKLEIAITALKELSTSDAYSRESKHMGINRIAATALQAITDSSEGTLSDE